MPLEVLTFDEVKDALQGRLPVAALGFPRTADDALLHTQHEPGSDDFNI